MAGIMGNRMAVPRLSPSAIWAICWAAKAGSQELRVEKIAPAMAVPARDDDDDDDDDVRDLGRFLRERREMGSFVEMGLLEEREGLLRDLGVLIMAIVAMVVAAIVAMVVAEKFLGSVERVGV